MRFDILFSAADMIVMIANTARRRLTVDTAEQAAEQNSAFRRADDIFSLPSIHALV